MSYKNGTHRAYPLPVLTYFKNTFS